MAGFYEDDPQGPDLGQGRDFFDYVLSDASSPLSGLMGAMQPAYAGDQGFSGGFSDSFTGDTGFTGGMSQSFGGDQGFFGGLSDSFSGMGSFAGDTGFVQGGGSDQSGIMASLQHLASAAFPTSTGSGVTGSYSGDRNTRIAQTIAREAARVGIDPEMALWVAQMEGGTDDAAANRRNRQGSQAYGPYQLLVNGGLGDEAIKAGIDPRDASTVEAQIRFALEHAARNGWGAWEAVTARGVDPWKGITRGAAPVGTGPPMGAGVPPVAPGSSPYAGFGTNPNTNYSIAFDYDKPYGGAQFNPGVPNHRGIDLVIPGAPNGGRGAKVGAFYPGVVEYVASDPNGGLGVIIHGDDGMYHHYYHLDGATVQKGARVVRGQQIGVLGASGTEGFPHLHYEVADGPGAVRHAVDPRPYLQAAR